MPDEGRGQLLGPRIRVRNRRSVSLVVMVPSKSKATDRPVARIAYSGFRYHGTSVVPMGGSDHPAELDLWAVLPGAPPASTGELGRHARSLGVPSTQDAGPCAEDLPEGTGPLGCNHSGKQVRPVPFVMKLSEASFIVGSDSPHSGLGPREGPTTGWGRA